MRSVQAEGLDAFDLEMALELVVQRVVAEGVAFETVARGEVVLQDQRAAVPAASHLELVLPREEVLVVLALARVFLLLGVEGKEEVLAAAVPSGLLLRVEGIDEEAAEYARRCGLYYDQVKSRFGKG